METQRILSRATCQRWRTEREASSSSRLVASPGPLRAFFIIDEGTRLRALKRHPLRHRLGMRVK